jgi:microsomal dipeptidase-like Zn-dependent dipeptidase
MHADETPPRRPSALGASPARRRLVWSISVAAGAVLVAGMGLPSFARPDLEADPTSSGLATSAQQGGADAFKKAAARTTAENVASSPAEQLPHTHSGATLTSDGHAHDHSDPATKNLISRSVSDSSDPLTQDPTTAEEAADNTATVAARRYTNEPTILPGPKPEPRRTNPEDRYAMAGGCYALASGDRWVQRSGDGFAATAGRLGGAEPFHFQATDLGKYLLYATQQDFLSAGSGDPIGVTGASGVVAADKPSESADWTVTKRNGRFRFRLPDAGKALGVDPGGDLVLADTPAAFTLRLTGSCAHWPEVRTNVSGRPHVGENSYDEVRGYADAHTHGMAFEFLGGDVHCGRPWHPYGVEYALVDCPDHTATDGKGAAMESFLSGDYDGHDPVGWPTFKDWPAPDSLTHEGTYYKWLERSWRGGLRVFVNLLVENDQLCNLYPIKHNSCDDMDSIRLQAKRMKELERYVDAQSGGPGEGWYRIVHSPFEARKVVNEGKLAVVMGIETSVVFGCSTKAGVPQCTADDIDRQLDEVHKMGVRQMELVNKFDNAMAGVAGDNGSTGVLVNSANFLETGSFWRMETCPSTYGDGVHDKEQYAVPREVSDRDPLFGAIMDVYGDSAPRPPVYPGAPHCNAMGLTDLGKFAIEGLAKRKMLFDPDHMSVLARKASLDLVEQMGYPGILSSHSWSTPDAYPRISKLGGFIAPYAGDSTGFVNKWKYHVGRADQRYYFGLGYGADINGLGAQGDPRGADAENPVTYPFRGLGGVTVKKQHSGERIYDINVDGVAHYGLYPDWIEDLRHLAGDDIVQDMARGAEAYLQTWERAVGVTANSCTGGSRVLPVSTFRDLPRGATTRKVLLAVGQPDARVGDAFTYCARKQNGARTKVRVEFTPAGHLTRVG